MRTPTVEQQLADQVRLRHATEQEVLDDLPDRQPIKRFAETTEAARAVAYLTSEEASAVTGTCLPSTSARAPPRSLPPFPHPATKRKNQIMRIGIPKEVKNHEYRVAITPIGVNELVAHGHEVYIETGAGVGSSISDAEYVGAGAKTLETADDIWGTAEMVLKVKEPGAEEYHWMCPGRVLFTYLHLAADKPLTEELLGQLRQRDRRRDRAAAGCLAPQVGAHALLKTQGGRGVLLGGVGGAANAKVVVIGAGVAGQNSRNRRYLRFGGVNCRSAKQLCGAERREQPILELFGQVSGVTLSDQPVRPSVRLRSQVAARSLPRGNSRNVRPGIPYELEVVLLAEEPRVSRNLAVAAAADCGRALRRECTK